MNEAPIDAGSESPGIDSDIRDEEILYRRLSYDTGDWVVRAAVTHERVRPASGAFTPDADGVSVYRDSRLHALVPSLGPSDLVVAAENVVVGFAAGDVRSIKLDVRDDPWPQDVRDREHPRNAAHALIIGWNGLGSNERRRRQKLLAELPSMRFVHP